LAADGDHPGKDGGLPFFDRKLSAVINRLIRIDALK
jgi:hypothetical protein